MSLTQFYENNKNDVLINFMEKRKKFLVLNDLPVSSNSSVFKFVNLTYFAAQNHPKNIFASTAFSVPKLLITDCSKLSRSFSEKIVSRNKSISWTSESANINSFCLKNTNKTYPNHNKCLEHSSQTQKRTSTLKRSTSLLRTKPIINKKSTNKSLFTKKFKTNYKKLIKTAKQKFDKFTATNNLKSLPQNNFNKHKPFTDNVKLTKIKFKQTKKVQIKVNQTSEDFWPLETSNNDCDINLSKSENKLVTQNNQKLKNKINLVHRPSSRLIRIFFPGSQMSAVVAEPGQTVRSTLKKSLTRCGLHPEFCAIETKDTGELVNWENDIASYFGREIIVINVLENGYPSPRISHSLISFKFNPSSCVYCSKYLFNGLTCSRCNIRFHEKCVEGVKKEIPSCKPTLATENNLICHLLSQNNNYLNTNHQSGFCNESKEKLSSNLTTKQFQINYKEAKNEVLSENLNHKSPQPLIKLKKKTSLKIEDKFEPTLPIINENDNYINTTDKKTIDTVTQNKNIDENLRTQNFFDQQINFENDNKFDKDLVTFECDSKKDDWAIDWKLIKKDKLVGTGTFGEVFKGTWHGPIAIKMLRRSNPTDQQFKDFQNEINILRKTRHANIVLFMGHCRKPLAIIMQWCDGRSLYRHLHVDETHLEIIQILKISLQTSVAMDYLHSKHIIHRDLKSNNIFLTKNFTVKIGDFGLSTIKMSTETDTIQYMYPTGSVLWMAPEVMRAGSNSIDPYTTKSDVYAFGIVLFELGTQTLPFNNFCPEMIIYNVGRGNPVGKIKLTNMRKDAPKGFIDLLNKCVEFNNESRPDFKQIHKMIQNLGKKIPTVSRTSSMPTHKAGTDDLDKYEKYFISKSNYWDFQPFDYSKTEY